MKSRSCSRKRRTHLALPDSTPSARQQQMRHFLDWLAAARRRWRKHFLLLNRWLQRSPLLRNSLDRRPYTIGLAEVKADTLRELRSMRMRCEFDTYKERLRLTAIWPAQGSGIIGRREYGVRGNRDFAESVHSDCPACVARTGEPCRKPLHGNGYLKDNESTYPLHMAASGEQVIIEYLARLTYPSPMNHSIILIDEPEIHLHPAWIRQLYLAFQKSA